MNIFLKEAKPRSWWLFLLATLLTLSGGVASAQSDEEEFAEEVVEAADEVDASSEPAPMEEVVNHGFAHRHGHFLVNIAAASDRWGNLS